MEALEKRISELEEQVQTNLRSDLTAAADSNNGDLYPSYIVREPEDCAEILANNPDAETGIHTINVGDYINKRMISVWCDLHRDGGGWTVFQRRLDGSIDFYRNWEAYADGFGSVDHEHWLGNDNLHYITSKKNYEMRVDLESFDNETRYAQYTTFRVNSACDEYRMTIDGYNGTAGDSMEYHNNMMFTTFDRPNNPYPQNCALPNLGHGAWWYKTCAQSNLNSRWVENGWGSWSNVIWDTWLGWRCLRETTMRIRPALLTCPK